ncbi:hypothetical protein ACLK11_18465 [Escherichia coli]
MGLRASQARFDRFSRSCWKSSKLAPPMRLTALEAQAHYIIVQTDRFNGFEQR